MSEYAIETNNLTKMYKSKRRQMNAQNGFFAGQPSNIVIAVDHLSLAIKKGELFGLLGPNGAGKTTLVKILCTLLPYDEGTATVNGFDVARKQMDVKKSIGTLFSIGERGFFWRLDGYKNLEFYSAVYNVPRNKRKERVSELIDLLGLREEAFEVFQKYSGGMKRKLALARALLPDPPVLLLDEPTIALDVMTSRSIREFIKNNLSRKLGKTVLYTTHYIEEASQICDKVGIMNKGRLIVLNTPEAIRNMVKKGESVELLTETISETNISALREIDGVINIVSKTEGLVPGQMQLRIRLSSIDLLPTVLDYFFKEKIKLINFKRDEPTLEDAFVELTGKSMSE